MLPPFFNAPKIMPQLDIRSLSTLQSLHTSPVVGKSTSRIALQETRNSRQNDT